MKRTLSVMQLLPNLESGGVETETLMMNQGLVAARHRSIVVSGGGAMVQKLQKEKGEHITLPIGSKTPTVIPYIFRLASLFKEMSVDIVHARSRLPAWVAYCAIKLLPSKARPSFITTVHGAYSVNAYSAIMTRGDYVIAISQYIKNYIVENYPKTPREKIIKIDRGIIWSNKKSFCKKEIADSMYKRYPQLKKRFIVLIPGRLTALKGQDRFVELIEQLHHSKGMQNVLGVIAGSVAHNKRNFLDRIQTAIEQKKLTASISILTEPSELASLMKIADVVVSLNRKPEAFGRVIVEALSYNTPVLAYAFGGAEEILSRLYPAGRVPPDDMTTMVKTIQKIYLGEVEKPDIPVNKQYTMQNMINQTIDLYQKIS